jgi:hypothetical protein
MTTSALLWRADNAGRRNRVAYVPSDEVCERSNMQEEFVERSDFGTDLSGQILYLYCLLCFFVRDNCGLDPFCLASCWPDCHLEDILLCVCFYQNRTKDKLNSLVFINSFSFPIHNTLL